MQYSEYQQAIFDELNAPRSRRHLAIIARAGSGKTTTIVEAIRRLPRGHTACYIPFNKAIADEGKNRLRDTTCVVQTLNSFGRSLVFKDVSITKGKRLTLNFKKNETILKSILAPEDFSAWGRYLTPILDKAVCLAKDMMYSQLQTVDQFAELFEDFDLTLEDYLAQNTDLASLVYDNWDLFTSPIYTETTCETDFADQLYLPFKHKCAIPVFTWCFIDEAQDLSPIQWDLIFRMSKYTNICFVGDPMQTIYEFRGASWLSMDAAINQLDAKVFSLPICYRCPTQVVSLAQTYVPDILPCDTAPPGIVDRLEAKEFYQDVAPAHAVLARTNAELIMVAHRLRFTYGKPCYIKGDGVLRSIRSIAKKAKLQRHSDQEQTIKAVEEEKQLRISKSRSGILPPMVKAAFNAMNATISQFDNWGDADDFLTTIFPDKFDGTNAIILTTIHKFKGREAKRVYYLNYVDLTPDIIGEEKRIAYVGITRSEYELYFVQVGSPYDRKKG